MLALSLSFAAVSAALALAALLWRRPDSVLLAVALGCAGAWCLLKSEQWTGEELWTSVHWLPAVAGWCGALLVLSRRMTTPRWRPRPALAAVLVGVPLLVAAVDLALSDLDVLGGWAEVGGRRDLVPGPGWYVVVFYDTLLVSATLYFLIARLTTSAGRDRWVVVTVLALLGVTAVAQAAPSGTDHISLFAALATWALAYGVLVERLTEVPPAGSVGGLPRLDPVTGCLDRASLDAALGHALTLAETTGQPLSLALLDVDDLKTVNDRDGHLAGDRVLRGLAESIGEARIPDAVLGRFGGDEFVLLLPGRDAAEATQVLSELRSDCRGPARLPDASTLGVTFSAGVASHLPGGSTRDLLEAADRAMYRAKAAGKDRHATDATATDSPARS
ncbi:GGDEF domain-containing protein [Nocardioides sp. zg-536]|uniref:GGDEF domain-containing protein n=1 Tax=Nocardioides faecalis TaxID=2803858 RepID=A0A938Y9F4_9ACTN|nr:GGDEF domain-containing protein [Nocardioides faecalis]MBM9459891.1 GGDEF domain-containing protein [Nocardioides faecalis]QVI58876.1 GGDEF domain-containing protein [Nocardioides faecalis]